MNLKTLKELADENGFPFDAVSWITELSSISKRADQVQFAAVSPREMYFGWRPDGSYYVISDSCSWTLTPKKKVLKTFISLREYSNDYYVGCSENPEEWCKMFNRKLIKILDEFEVDV